MPLYKAIGEKAELVQETSFRDADISEAQLEGWIASNADVLGEPFLVFGRQVQIPGLGDTIDLLALDKNGAVVVIEIKRADLKVPVDIQGLRYASYVSGWRVDALEAVAAAYFDTDEDERGLEARFQEFAEAAGGDEDSTLNHTQRVVIVGQKVRDRLGSVALWLRQQGVDLKLVEIHPYTDGDELYLEPIVIIPPPITEEWEVVGAAQGRADRPWIGRGTEWHKKRAGDASFERAQNLIAAIEDAGLVDAVSYDQKHYIAVRRGARTWLRIAPRRTGLRVDVRCNPGDFQLEKLSERLGLIVFTGEENLKEKLALPSSVGTYQRSAYYCIRLRLKDDFDIGSRALMDFLRESASSA